jgi:pyrophosphatase PpaX
MVSSSGFTKEALAADNLERYFDAVIGGLDVENHKPKPDPVLLALEKIDVIPDQALMVGDLAVDILSGKAAGVRATVGLTYGFGSRKMLKEAGADYLLDSLEALPEIIQTIMQDGPQDR